MVRPEQSSQEPAWRATIDALLADAYDGRLAREDAIIVTTHTLAHLYTTGQLTDAGELQGYLRSLHSPIQLVAMPVSAEQLDMVGLDCLDPLSHEPHGHYLQVSVGYNRGITEAATQLAAIGMTYEVNEACLSQDVGFLTERQPGLFRQGSA